MRARFLGTDPDSQEGQSPTLFVTDTDRRTFIAQGWNRDSTPRCSRTSAPFPTMRPSSRFPRTS